MYLNLNCEFVWSVCLSKENRNHTRYSTKRIYCWSCLNRCQCETLHWYDGNNQFPQGWKNREKRYCHPAILRVGLTELGFRSLLGRGPQPVLVLQRRSPGELGPDLEGCAPWQVLDLTGDALKLLWDHWKKLWARTNCCSWVTTVGLALKWKASKIQRKRLLFPWSGRAPFAEPQWEESWQMRCNLQSASPSVTKQSTEGGIGVERQ